jgi:hypothetical protein
MIKIENVEVHGWEPAIRGMRNPKNSWERSDSVFHEEATTTSLDNGLIRKQFVQYDALSIGENDHTLMMNLANSGPVHAKYRRMITVYVDITAPLYWWKEFDTYKVGTVANSCSTMHKIHEKEFHLADFSCEHLRDVGDLDCVNNYPNDEGGIDCWGPLDTLGLVIESLNHNREKFLETKDKKYWWQMIQLLPSSYNQKRTLMLNYEVLAGIYEWRKNHKLDEWRELCNWIETLPYSEIITGEKEDSNGNR